VLCGYSAGQLGPQGAGVRKIWAADFRFGEAEVGLLEMEDGEGGTVFYPCAPRAGVVTYRIIR
jgi:hypothetical protein